MSKIGIVLSGGGAKGAYQVGMIKALSELDIQIDIVSGASIGALNGAILASSLNLHQAAHRMEDIWTHLASENIFVINKFVYINFLLLCCSALGRKNTVGISILGIFTILKKYNFIPKEVSENITDLNLFSDDPLCQLLEKHLNYDDLAGGLPLYVSLYPSKGWGMDVFMSVAASTGISSTPNSIFKHVQSLSMDEQKDVLLASAALPLLFKSKEVKNGKYSDGGIGGWNKSQGNTPITPLIENDCKIIIVNHLSADSPWNKHDYADTDIIEVRPYSTTKRNQGFFGETKDLISFNPEHINSWIEQGYQDTLVTFEKIKLPL